MQSADLQVLRAAGQWLADGHRVALATVLRTWGSSPRPPGALSAVRDDGRMEGSVAGGCVERDLAARIRTDGLPGTVPQRITYGVSAEDNRRLGLPCGGRLELVLEELAGSAQVQALIAVMSDRRLLARRLCLDTGEASLHPAARGQDFAFDGRNVTKVFGPGWRLLIIGAAQASRFLAEMAQALDYEVVICEPRPDLAADWTLAQVPLDARMPDEAAAAWADDSRSAVVALTHDPKLDDLALMQSLDSAAFYVGALGSRAHAAKRRQRLASLGVSAGGLARLHGPVGLAIGSRTPAEIAVAVLAGLTAERHGMRLAPVTEMEPAAYQGSACS